jgi:hypothetical protein
MLHKYINNTFLGIKRRRRKSQAVNDISQIIHNYVQVTTNSLTIGKIVDPLYIFQDTF